MYKVTVPEDVVIKYRLSKTLSVLPHVCWEYKSVAALDIDVYVADGIIDGLTESAEGDDTVICERVSEQSPRAKLVSVLDLVDSLRWYEP